MHTQVRMPAMGSNPPRSDGLTDPASVDGGGAHGVLLPALPSARRTPEPSCTFGEHLQRVSGGAASARAVLSSATHTGRPISQMDSGTVVRQFYSPQLAPQSAVDETSMRALVMAAASHRRKAEHAHAAALINPAKARRDVELALQAEERRHGAPLRPRTSGPLDDGSFDSLRLVSEGGLKTSRKLREVSQAMGAQSMPMQPRPPRKPRSKRRGRGDPSMSLHMPMPPEFASATSGTSSIGGGYYASALVHTTSSAVGGAGYSYPRANGLVESARSSLTGSVVDGVAPGQMQPMPRFMGAGPLVATGGLQFGRGGRLAPVPGLIA